MSEDCHDSGSQYAHRYYCADCKEYVIADSAAALAVKLNGHNNSTHLTNFAKWTEALILGARWYEGHIAAPAYIVKHATGGEVLSAKDRELLDMMHIKWE